MEIYQYIRELHAFVEKQSKKLRKLEKAMLEMNQELVKLKERPPIQVGNLEYKFDQLKVETLEGTPRTLKEFPISPWIIKASRRRSHRRTYLKGEWKLKMSCGSIWKQICQESIRIPCKN
jgi:hypothetical protein